MIEPAHLFTYHRSYYFIAYCYYRDEWRTFKLSRIDHAGPLNYANRQTFRWGNKQQKARIQEYKPIVSEQEISAATYSLHQTPPRPSPSYAWIWRVVGIAFILWILNAK